MRLAYLLDWAGRPSTLVLKDGSTYLRGIDDLERFAALVRNATLEEAAGVCDDKHDEWRFGDGEDAASGPKDCAAAIRAMKEQT